MGLGNGVEKTKGDGDGGDGDVKLWREVGGSRVLFWEGDEIGMGMVDLYKRNTFLILKRISGFGPYVILGQGKGLVNNGGLECCLGLYLVLGIKDTRLVCSL